MQNANADADADQAAVPNAGALLDAQRQADLQKLPLFFGTDKDVFTAEQWVERIRRARTALAPNWNNETTMAAVYNSLRGQALEWYEAVQFDIDINNWDAFKDAFIQAFSKTRTTRTTVAVLSGLNQRHDEKVVSFYSRVAKANLDVQSLENIPTADMPIPATPWPADFTGIQAFNNLPAAVRQNAAQTLVQYGFNLRQDRLAKHLFLAGLKTELRDELLKNPPNGGLFNAFGAALSLEKVMEKPKIERREIHAIDDHHGECGDEICKINKRRSNITSGSDQGSGNRMTGPSSATKGYSKRNVTCFHCQKKGHYAADCYSKQRGEPPKKANRNQAAVAENTEQTEDDGDEDDGNGDQGHENPFAYATPDINTIHISGTQRRRAFHASRQEQGEFNPLN